MILHNYVLLSLISGTTVLFGHYNTEPATIDYRLPELFGELTGLVMFQPVVVPKIFADTSDGFINGTLMIG